MPNWKKLIVSGSQASLSGLQLTDLSVIDDDTVLVIDDSGNVGTKENAASSGTSGANGGNGTSGTSGANGGNGTSGTSGANGGNGTSGINGTSGTSGANGGNGTSGTSGANGGNGTSGTSGANGGNGTSGINGTSGTSGLLNLSGTTNNGSITYNSTTGGGTVEPNVQFTTANALFQTSQFNVNSQNAYFNIDQTHFGNENNYGQLILADDYYGGELGLMTTDDVLIAAQMGNNIVGLAGEYPGAQIIEIDFSKHTGKTGFGHTIQPSATHSYIAGGCNNEITGSHSFIGGGRDNIARDTCDFIGGGCANRTSQVGAGFNTIVSGKANSIDLFNTACLGNFIGGGQSNCLMGNIGWATIGGGKSNCVTSNSAFVAVGGGCGNNIIQANGATIAGGIGNKLGASAQSDNATIGGGCANLIGNQWGNSQGTTIGGGRKNEIKGGSATSCVTNSTVGGGFCNRIFGCDNVVGGGIYNDINTCRAFIGGGCNNTINSFNGGILGGTSNTINSSCTFIIGTGITAGATNYTFMNNACVLGATRTTFLIETSAKKHKECILPLESQIENIKKLEPVSFTWKEDKKEDIGLIAEQVETVLPKMVSYEEDGELHGVQYSKLTAVLIKAFQEQQHEIENLKLEIDKLKNK